MIDVQNASFTYSSSQGRSTSALNDVTLAIDEGEFVALVGRNGSGKSTLAMLMNGLLTPSSGRVLVDGLDTSDPAHVWEVRRRVGMVFQNPDNQIVATRVEEDVAFGPENLGVPPDEIRDRVGRALAAVHMSEFADFEPHLLSGGQKQRVAVAGTLAMESRCLVLDEPTSMLDPAGREEVMATVARLNASARVTIVLVTHRLEEAWRAGRVIVLDEGRVAAEGPPAEVLLSPEDLRLWGLAVPPLVEVRAALAGRGVDVPPECLTADRFAEFIADLAGEGSR